jgi:hypothetical protein
MGLRELLDDLLPVDTPEEVAKKMMDYGRKHPEMSEADVIEMFSGSMKRAKRKQKEKETKSAMDTAEAKRKITKAEGKSKGGYMKKTQMAYGGMAGGKKHMYLAGGSVTENPGLKALKKASPEAYNKITGK